MAPEAALSLDPSNSSKNTLKLENTEKRDTLIAIEKKYQRQWAEDAVFQVDAPSTTEIPLHSISAVELHARVPKFFGTMAYPYMNGTLHMGHSFTASKVEFTTGFARMQKKRALFPLGFHCTGMPIKACADKLVREVELFGQEFERCPELNQADSAQGESGTSADHGPPAPTQGQTREDVTKFTTKKSKTAAKSVHLKYQFQIMMTLGIPIHEIHRFADPQYWLTFFPPLCQRDLTNFGARIDWRRSFVTTDANLYYDAFVRWQMNRLKELGKIKYGKRETIYSPKDGQPCMDHDRSTGEGIGPQKYTGLKLKVKEWAPDALEVVQSKLLPGSDVFLVAATLRPETMYGQTCCFVGRHITYGLYQVNDKECFVMTDRAARNLAFQGVPGIFPTFGEYSLLVEVPGSSLVGTLVNAPLSVHTSGVRVLPMETVMAAKGTGIVTSVPSDSPHDYATVMDLAKKAEYYRIKKEWAELKIVPIIQTPSYGDLTAPFLVKKMKINSPKDTKQLEEAKDLAYKEGYYQGVIVVGDFKGMKVSDAKESIHKHLEEHGEAFVYWEPEGLVMSRSADECVVAKLDQWYLNYGADTEWRDQTMSWVKQGLNSYTTDTKNGLEAVINWLNRWACARTYGLGSRLPFDPHFLVESLSDSTIYMAYYTIAHYLHQDIFGKKPGLANIKPEQMTDEVWDYVFAGRKLDDHLIEKTGISKKALESMRREFEYWYPLDMRVSGKDLINNHLVFFLYIHIALFPARHWPRSIRVNGHLLLNGEKMSKHTGNFLTLDETVRKYGADATRIALADAGDGVEDANFEESVANSTILRLYTLKEWCETTVKEQKDLRTGLKATIWDRLFENEMNGLVHEVRRNYEDTMYKAALKSALYDFTSARDFYREVTSATGVGMHRELALRYIELQALLITPIAPHWAEYIWLEVLYKPSTIQNEPFPTAPTTDLALAAAREYVRATTSSITSAEAAQQKKKDKGKHVAFDPRKPKQLTVFAASKFPSWQDKYIDLVRDAFDATHLTVDDASLNGQIATMGEMKKAMPFVQGLKRRLVAGERAQVVFERQLAFDELATLQAMAPGIKKTAGCQTVTIVAVDEGGKTGRVVSLDGGANEQTADHRMALPPSAEGAVPGHPTFFFENVVPEGK
ncbi:MAG: cytosolic leucyl tRNA synthetase [Phylliscum demangeonii]|nr:MAG: cytosolic leucyl tRNA synthetase [Phylliscum demangeonii]